MNTITSNKSAHGSMKMFLWKEARENWQSVLWGPLTIIVLFALAGTYNASHRSVERSISIAVSDMQLILTLICLMSAVLCGSSAMATEIGNGTLQFLSSLPISRQRIWCTKFATGLISAALSVAASYLAFSASLTVAAIAGAFTLPMHPDPIGIQWIAICLIVPLFSMGMLMTMLFDRTVTAAAAAVIASCALGSLILTTPSLFSAYGTGVLGVILLVSLATATCFSMSYETFMRGETLKTSNRFKVAIPGLLIDMAILIAAFAVSLAWILA